MTLLHMDGFDAGDSALRYASTGINGTTSSTRFGTGLAAQLASAPTGTLTKALPASAELYMGVAMNISLMDAAIRPTLAFFGDSGVTRHITVGLRANGVEVRRGLAAGTLLDSNTLQAFAANTWYWVEVYVKIADTGGRVTVKVDGATMVDFTGDTKNAGTATTIDAVLLTANGTAVLRLDDLYMCDSAGSAPYNTFLGDVRVATLSPSGAGATTGMTPSAGSNFQCVDEQPYSATDYVTGAAGQKDTYALADLPSGVASVLAVQTNVVAKKSDAGALSLRTVVRASGTDYPGSTISLGTADAVVSTLRTTNPATSAAWSTSGVNALEAGAEVV